MGHSMGGLLVQILLDHGYGAAGVAIDSVPAEGIKVVPVSQIRALFPILRHPSERHKAVGFTLEQFHNGFALRRRPGRTSIQDDPRRPIAPI
jgi:hypothetical protein